jgi:outer membrane protein TolC
MNSSFIILQPRYLNGILLILFLLPLFSPEVFSSTGEGKKITLEDCIRRSLENSPRLKIATLEQIRLGHQYRTTLGAGLPQVSLSGSYDDFLNLPTQMIPNIFSTPPNPSEMIPVQFGTSYNITGSLDISQVIYNQSWLTALRMAKLTEQQNELETEKVRTNVVHEVAQSYFMTQITSRQINNLKSNAVKLERAEKIATSQFESGLIMRVDVDRIVVQRLNLQTELERLEVLLQQQLDMQKYYMGIPLNEEIRISDSVTMIPIPTNRENPDRHIDMRLIGMQKQLAGATVKLDQSAWYPGISLIGSTNYMNQSNTFYLLGDPTVWYNTSVAGIRLSVPLFTGFQQKNKVSQSKVMLEKLKVMEEDTRRLITVNSEDAFRTLKSSTEAESRQRENMKLAERVYNVTQEQYQKGVIPLTDLLNAETALSNAQANHTYALIQLKINELNFLKANNRLLEYFKIDTP